MNGLSESAQRANSYDVFLNVIRGRYHPNNGALKFKENLKQKKPSKQTPSKIKFHT